MRRRPGRSKIAVSRVGVESPLNNQKFRAALTDVFAGIICSILSIAYCLSYAALIFTGPLEHLLSYGVAVTFLSAAVGGSIVALRSSLPFALPDRIVPFPWSWRRWWRPSSTGWSRMAAPICLRPPLSPCR
jgi:hypothetical protein